MNKSLQYSTITRIRTQTRIEIKFEVSVNFIEIKPHQIPTSTQIKHQTSPNPYVLATLQFTSTYEPPSDHQWGAMFFKTPSLV